MHSHIVAREGWPFIALFGAAAFILLVVGVWGVGVPLLLLALFTVYFFRNPERVPTKGEGLVIAPADGTVVELTDMDSNKFTNGPAKKIGIFMSVFNVHVNRVPVEGEVVDVQYHPGKFLVASRDKASDANERNAVYINAGSFQVAVVQIAGLVARRIVCYLKKGERVLHGQRLGLIRFGSRVDIYLPPESTIHASIGDRVKAGVTIMGRL